MIAENSFSHKIQSPITAKIHALWNTGPHCLVLSVYLPRFATALFCLGKGEPRLGWQLFLVSNNFNNIPLLRVLRTVVSPLTRAKLALFPIAVWT
jgi:hypothetical protein